jgi:hypothetical protein
MFMIGRQRAEMRLRRGKREKPNADLPSMVREFSTQAIGGSRRQEKLLIIMRRTSASIVIIKH